MTQPTTYFQYQAHPTGSTSELTPKRKRASSLEPECDFNAKHLRLVSPAFDRRPTFPLATAPDLMTDTSASASVSADSDHAMDMDSDMVDMDVNSDCHDMLDRVTVELLRNEGQYSYAEGGSGGFGFGPGADEDDGMDDDASPNGNKLYYPNLDVYPSLIPHPNPHHFSNHISYTAQGLTGSGVQANSPWSAQPFATTLRAPGTEISAQAGAAGIIQPASSGPLPINASAIDRARNTHGPQCTSIPKLRLSDYPDALTGERSLWSVCQDCGACERAK